MAVSPSSIAVPTHLYLPQWIRVLGLVLLAVYVLLVGFIVLWPTHVDDISSGRYVLMFLHTGHSQGWLPLWFTYQTVEWLSNVVMFVPGGFLMALLFERVRSWVPLLAFATTCGVESTQYFMPGRTSSVWDIVANTLGGTVGWGCALFLLWAVNTLRILRNKRARRGLMGKTH